MKNNEFMNNLTRTFSKIGLQIKKHSPEILITVGVVGTVASAVMACTATTKINTILDEAKKDINTIHKASENPELAEKYTKKDSQKDLAIVYGQTAWKLVKLYAPSVILGAASLSCIITSHNIVRKRNIALAAAYTAVDHEFKDYRGRVVERFGEELDKELKHNLKVKEVEETVVDENGEEKTVKKTAHFIDSRGYSPYAQFFDDGCEGWSKDPEENKFFLLQQQRWANEKLKAKGHLFLNEVYEMLGMHKTSAGQMVGWVYDPKDEGQGDNYVDFGIFDVYKEGSRDFVNGRERTILLDFNVDGNILDLLA